MEVELETPVNGEKDITDEHYSDDELGLDHIKRKRLYPQCIIDSDSNSDSENNEAINEEHINNEPQNVVLKESDEQGHFLNYSDEPNETYRNNVKLETIDDTMNSPDSCADLGADMSDMVKNLLQNRNPGISTLQCSECDLECPSLPALEFHTKLHVMERIVQRSYKYPGIGLRQSSDKININKTNKLKNGDAKTRTTNRQNALKENNDTHIDEAKDIETIMESLLPEGASKGISNRDSEKPHECDECGSGFTCAKNLERHMETHTGDKPYACTQCDYSSGRKDTLKVHMKRHFAGSKKIRTPKRKKKKIKNPKRKVIKVKKVKLSQKYKGLNCPECDYKSTSTPILRLHMVEHSDQRPFKCEECNIRFNAKNSWKEHRLTHYARKFFSCTFCEYTCSRKAQHTRHMLTHTGTKPHECPLCDYRCNEKGNLTMHMVTHSDEKPFSCPEEGCVYKCKFKFNLKTHMLKHTGEKPYACHLCDYRSIVKGTLNTHIINKHSGEKPFPCHVCGNRYAVKGDLNIHMRIHTKIKNFQCPLCEYRGYTKQKVNQHMFTHTGEKPHECEVCGFRFANPSNLKKHMRTHTGEKLFACTECNFKCSRNNKLKIHMQGHMTGQKIHHPEISNDSSQAHQFIHQVNTQPLNNQHILGANNLMGRGSQETTHTDVNYKMYSNNMEYHSLSKRYDNFPPSAKPLWHQGSSSLPAVNTDGYNPPLAHYPRPMFLDSPELTHFNSKFSSTVPVPPNMSDLIRHANDMYNIQ